jgi:hypothetical protein
VFRFALFWNFKRHCVTVPNRCFGTTYRSPIQWSKALEDGTGRCPETSARNYHSTLRKIPEERRCHAHRGGSLGSHIVVSILGVPVGTQIKIKILERNRYTSLLGCNNTMRILKVLLLYAL